MDSSRTSNRGLGVDVLASLPYVIGLWSPYVIRQIIIFLPCDFYLLLLFFFLAQSQRSETGCLPYFRTWCGLSANLECRSETCCTWLAENTGRKNVAKNCHLGTIAQPCCDTCLSCEDIARQSCAMVPRWRFLATFLRPVFSASRVQHILSLIHI